MPAYELKLASGAVVRATGTDGVDAARRYVDLHRQATVVAWREPRHGLRVGAPGPGSDRRRPSATYAARVAEQRRWMEAHGRGRGGYIAHYGALGVDREQASAIYRADLDHLNKLIAGQARTRPTMAEEASARRCPQCSAWFMTTAQRDAHVAKKHALDWDIAPGGLQASAFPEHRVVRPARPGTQMGLFRRVRSRSARRQGRR